MVSETPGHAEKSVRRQVVARGSTRGPGIATEQSRREHHGRHAPRVSLPSRRFYCHF